MKLLMSQSLQQKNTRILLKWLPLVMLAGSVFLYFLMRGHILHMQEQQLHLKQNNIWRSFSDNPESLPLHIPGEYDITPERGAAIQVSDRPRDTILKFPGSPAETFNLLTTRFSDGEQAYLITSYISSKEVTHLIIKIAVADALIFLLLLGAIVVVNRRISRRLWAPFYATMDTIRSYDVRQNETITLLANTSVEEFDRLNQTLTSLIEDVHRAYHNQKQFTENAAHELQTPLAIIRSKVELMMEGAALNEDTAYLLGEINEANERLSQMSRNLLLLTRIENRQFPEEENVYLSRLVQKQTAFFSDYFQEEVTKTTTDIAPGIRLTANAALLEILVNNLLRNAYIHNIAGGYVHVCLTPPDLLVENSGPEIEGDPARLFDRFKKGREDSRTTGLGLALVHQICQLYQFGVRYGYHGGVHQLRVTFANGA
jgi:signal transduction histidine kinase